MIAGRIRDAVQGSEHLSAWGGGGGGGSPTRELNMDNVLRKAREDARLCLKLCYFRLSRVSDHERVDASSAYAGGSTVQHRVLGEQYAVSTDSWF